MTETQPPERDLDGERRGRYCCRRCFLGWTLGCFADGHPLERCVLFAREIAELKLTTVGPLPSTIDRDQIYVRLPETSEASKIREAL